MRSNPASLADRSARFHPTSPHPDDTRTQSQQDRDRLLYTPALRRLAGITQVAAPTERYILHNRLTHTLEVAQVGRRLAERLLANPGADTQAEAIGGLDPDVVEAAALAHDLGHPPFGHIAEQELDRLAVRAGLPDGFDGNAQSFRIVTRLGMRWWPDFPGLNLTRATLNAVLKYPWLRAPNGERHNKWGVYSSDEDVFQWVRQVFTGTADERGLEAELMDWADDIAYAVHDLEDFYCAGLIPLDRLTWAESQDLDQFVEVAWRNLRHRDNFSAKDVVQEVTKDLLALLPAMQQYRGLRQQRADLRRATSLLVGRFITAVSLVPPGEPGPRVRIEPSAVQEVAILKQLTWQYVINTPSLAAQQHGQRRVIRDLFRVFHHAIKPSGNRNLLPESYREEFASTQTDEDRIRLVIDLIASMTEQQALDMHRRLIGVALGSALDTSGL